MKRDEKSGFSFWAFSFQLLSLLVVSGCVARYVRIEEKGLTCAEAHQLAITAVQRMGYTITEVTKPTPGAPGIVTAARQEGTNKQGMLVQVFCTTLGATVEAKTEQGGLAQLNFPSEFKRHFEAVVASRPPPRKAAESGVDVLLTPERGAVADLGVDLRGTGVLPVSVRITNRTSRSYRFRVKDVVLQTADGERATALKVKDLAGQITPEAANTLQQKILGDRDIKPDETLTGFLLFPFKAYARARVVLIDQASDEPEGFAIEF